METFLILCWLAVLLGAWAYLRKRFAEMDSRLVDLAARLEGQRRELAELKKASTQAAPMTKPEPEPGRLLAVERPAPGQAGEAAALPPPVTSTAVRSFRSASRSSSTSLQPRSSAEWEALLGGNWLNKAGVFILVVGIALALGYSFTRLGPWGRVGISLVASLALLAIGAVLELREPYRMFARGLLGGGWAALYVTVFAMHAVDAARVIPSPIAGGILLLGVAVVLALSSGMYSDRQSLATVLLLEGADIVNSSSARSSAWSPWIGRAKRLVCR